MAAQVYIDGVEIIPPVGSGTSAIEGSVTRKLNLPWQASVKVPMHLAVGGPGSRLKVVLNGSLWFHGMILNVETDTGTDTGYTVYNATDPMELWQWRPARDPDGDYSKPTFIEDNVTGPQIMEAILTQSEDTSNPGLVGDGEGPLFISFGSFEGGGVDMTGAPTDWPMTIAEIASLLTSTGELDIVLTPIDSGGNMAQVNCYNGDFGNDLSGSVVFEYGMGTRNVERLRVNEDMSNMVNKLRYLLGPRVLTSDDPAGDQHWRASIEGGALVPDPPLSDVLAKTSASRTTYGVRSEIKIFDARGDEAVVGRELYERLWLQESWIRSEPRFMVHATPRGGYGVGLFDIGDLVTVRASSAVRGGFSGAQRVYQYTVSWNEDSVLRVSELQTSPNQEGAIR